MRIDTPCASQQYSDSQLSIIMLPLEITTCTVLQMECCSNRQNQSPVRKVKPRLLYKMQVSLAEQD